MINLWQTSNTRNQTDAIYSYRRYLVRFGFIYLFVLGLLTASITAQEEEESGEDCTKSSEERDDKSSRTPAQRKLSSELLDRIKGKQDTTRLPTTPDPGSHNDVDPKKIVLVDINATVTVSLLQHIETLGGTLINSFPEYQAIRANIPVEKLETLAESSDVVSIRAADTFQLHRY